MKAHFVLLALVAVSSLANAKEMLMNQVDSARTFNDLARTVPVTKESFMRSRVSSGDVTCIRDLVVKAESASPFQYACTYFVEDSYAPAAQDTRARSSKRVQ